MVNAAQKRASAVRAAIGPAPRGQWSLGAGDTAAVPSVRHGIMDALRRDAVRDADLWSAEIIVAELLSNAVMHTHGPASVTLHWDGDYPLLNVCDDGPGLVMASALRGELPADDLADGGRGLFLVANLARGVTVAGSGHGGSQVSVMLDVPRSG